MSELTFGIESLEMLLDEGCDVLAQAHYEEIALNQDKIPLDINWEHYLEMEMMRLFHVFGARADGELIGYITAYVHYSYRYQTTRFVEGDVFWLMPKYRHKAIGRQMFEEWLKVVPRPSLVILKEKIGFEGGRVGPILESLGLKHVENVHSVFLE